MKMGIQHKGNGGKGGISKSKKNKKRQKKLPAVQKLYDSCKEVFSGCDCGGVPSPEKVEELKDILDGMSEADVGLNPNMPFFSSEAAPTITYLHLHECHKFSIGIFCLPPTSVIPLHNHPRMTVFSKLLFGTMHIKAYDWVNNQVDHNTSPATSPNIIAPKRENEGLRLAEVKINSEFTAPCTTNILYPADGGNMHCFTAKTACAVLDVLGPPYSDPDGRHCQYYNDFPIADLAAEGLVVEEKNGKGYAWLKERENPQELSVVGAPYNGPNIVK